MESPKDYDDCDQDLVRRSSANDSASYKRNVRSQSCFTPPASLSQRPQMRQQNGEMNIVDLMSDKKPSINFLQRRSKSVVAKPTAESKTRRLSKYLTTKRTSICSMNIGEPPEASSLEKISSKKCSRPEVSLQGCTEEDELNTKDITPPDSTTSTQSFSFDTSAKGFKSTNERRGSNILSAKKNSSICTSPGIVLTKNESSPSKSARKNPFVQYKNEVDDWNSYDMTHPRSSLKYNEKFDLSCKVVLLGDSGVGKTCLLMKFKDGYFLSGSYISTVGIDFRNKIVTVDDSRVKLQIWDTAGQERFRSVTHAYYRDAHALLLLYDVSSKTSFDNTRAWLAEVHEYAQCDVVIMLIGNKCDTPYADRQIRKEDGERLAREYDVAFMETSAKTGLNVDLAFTAIARDLKARKSERSYEKRFNVSEYVQKEAKSQPCSCSVG